MRKSKTVEATPSSKSNIITGAVSFVVGFATERIITAVLAKKKAK